MMQVPTPRTRGRFKQPLAFDYQATTPCHPDVVSVMTPYWHEEWGNSSSRQNRMGLMASAAVSLAREKIAACLKVHPERLIFTSGATEANNIALLGHARAMAAKFGKPGHLITLSTEHHAVLDPLRQLQKEGFKLTELNPCSDGIVNLEELDNAFRKDTFIVSVMLANNEIGVIQPIEEIAKLCARKEVTFHTDAAQAFGQLPIEPHILGIDLLTISAHKIYGPKGIGALFIRDNLPIIPLQWGGSQEQSIRPGTLPVPLIIGFAKAAELAYFDLQNRSNRMAHMRDQLWEGLNKDIPDLLVNGSMKYRLANNLNFTISRVKGSLLYQHLRPVLSCSSGSACSNGKPSHVLQAIGRSVEESESSIRLSIGRETTNEEIKEAISLITDIVNALR